MNAGASELYVAALLGNFFDAGASVQVLLGDMDRTQYENSRLARPAILAHLGVMVDTVRALPAAVRDQMPEVDWQAWEDLGLHLPPRSEGDRRLVWIALSAWMPATGRLLRRYRRQLPALWQYRL